MTMTEEEARTKWCPMHRVSASPAGDIYGNMPNRNADTCAASLCMAWRWQQSPQQAAMWAKLSADGVAAGGKEWTDLDPVGFCGLAGSP